MERTSREAWAKRVERWKDSGLTAAEFAAEIGVRAGTLSWWKWRLASAAEKRVSAGRAPRARPRVAVSTKAISPLTFVEVAAPVSAERIEVVLPSSIRIRIPATFDTVTLGRVLDVLEQRR